MRIHSIEADDIGTPAGAFECAGALMILPFTDKTQAHRAQVLAAARSGIPQTRQDDSLLLAVHDAHRRGFISVVNQVFEHSHSRWFGYLAQDAYAGRDWLSRAISALESRQAGLLAFNDGKWQGQLAAFGLAERAWIRSVYGTGFFFPGYRSHYADVELTLIARQQQRLAYDPDCVMVEVDWAKESTAVHGPDRRLFKLRAQQGFGGRVQNPDLLGLFG